MIEKPIIGITMGCPVSIGPELILKHYSKIDAKPYESVVLGDMNVLSYYNDRYSYNLQICNWLPGQPFKEGCINVLSLSALPINSLEIGQPTKDTGVAMATYITEGARLCKEGYLDGIATCPIAKSTLNLAGYNYPGHTEMLAHLTGANLYGMMMTGDKLRVTLATIHCPFKDITKNLSISVIEDIIQLTHTSLKNDFGLRSPNIAIAALNPHGGEQAIFGNEENSLIIPAIKKCQENHINASGPFPADTVFHSCAQGDFDAVVCMYHDQGLIPFKLLHFSDGVNVTMGLPIVRTSVDHGTAYDIAGKGIADPTSLTQAILLASEISLNRKEQ